ncbi:putative zinc binding protein [Cardiosporidium cionae]|uniref:Protein yippee-like n=1 Tax=Cardiosporidium cionae TaxID=476202 RepID=A0ABQ7J9M1_9APIC|nr:putative zinc binding protein [Cardiosporidium cionae]|eukprot:KAF8820653.1 putative zinc binding protein [Cardiosporidium cionae]
MGKLFKKYLSGRGIFICALCSTHLTVQDHLVSTEFRGQTGTAWLFKKVFNISKGQLEERVMTTGRHTIVDIYCNDCGTNLGWKYVEAEDPRQKYKKGKFILEKALLASIDTDRDGGERPSRLLSAASSDDEF